MLLGEVLGEILDFWIGRTPVHARAEAVMRWSAALISGAFYAYVWSNMTRNDTSDQYAAAVKSPAAVAKTIFLVPVTPCAAAT